MQEKKFVPKIKLQIAIRAILMFWNDPSRWIFLLKDIDFQSV